MCHAFEGAVTRTHTHCSCTHRGSPGPPWVGGSPVAFLVATRQSSALPICTFSRAQYVGKAATCPQAQAGHVSEQCVGRLRLHNSERHWQRLGSHREERPVAQHTRGSPRHVSLGTCCAIILSSFPSWSDRKGAHGREGSTAR